MDNGLYWRTVNGGPIFVTVYVDDLLIAASEENVKLVVCELERKFKIKDLGPVHHLLAMEITYIPRQAIWISQSGYIQKILENVELQRHQALGPLPLPATDGEDGVYDPKIPYRAIVGCLQYLVQCTRPEIANAVRSLGKYLNKYTKENYVMAKRVLRYLRGITNYGFVWEKVETPDLHFVAFADAEPGDGRHSITGFVLQLNGCTFAYKSRKQRIVTDDTCCAEFVAASECATMIIWTHNLCKVMNLDRHRPKILYQDNLAAITVLTGIKGNYKTKSVDLKYHKVRDYHERGVFKVCYCPSADMLADIFTKPLGPTLFKKFRQQLNVMRLPIVVGEDDADSRDLLASSRSQL
ncbi:polyprotein [Phytophthora palmivora]|uniref:Polyprotein n=1 Tax=Phytophthora palmivora TaxID=4796 RepID=A0A2P4X1M0_9STRA|nr:polyprotein [Phytophthora palmivora]